MHPNSTPPPLPNRQLVSVCDASPEAERYIAALRSQGYVVTTADLGSLIEHSQETPPALVICDIDQPGALDIIRRLHALPDAGTLDVLAVGVPGQTLAQQADAVAFESSGQILRPVDPNVLVLTVETLIGAAVSPKQRDEGSGELGPLSIIPGPTSSQGAPASHMEISVALAVLLQAAEERVAAHIQKEPETRAEPDDPEPELIPKEALDALRKPLSGNEPSDENAHPSDPPSGDSDSDSFRDYPVGSHRPAPNSDDFPADDFPELDTGRFLGAARNAPNTEPPEGGTASSLLDAQEDLTRDGRGDTTGAGTDHKPAHAAQRATLPPPRRASDRVSQPPSDRQGSALGSFSADSYAPRDPITANPDPHARERSSPSETPGPSAPRAAPVAELPQRLGPGVAAMLLGQAVRGRFTGAIACETTDGIRRMLLKDGDLVTVVSGNSGESLIGFLAHTGEIEPDAAAALDHRLPAYGRHTGTALIARGHLKQEQLWPTLRAHAEWLLTHILGTRSGTLQKERDVPERLAAEPTVFGGATGAEVLIDGIRRAIEPADAIGLLGGGTAIIRQDRPSSLLAECALTHDERQALDRAFGLSLQEATQGSSLEDLPTLLFALFALGVIQIAKPSARPSEPAPEPDSSRHEAVDARRSRIAARKALVDDGDYFAVLGVSPEATAYDVRRAYVELRRQFEPSRILTVDTADLADDVGTIVEVLDEAYAILRDSSRRAAYRNAITPAASSARWVP